MTDPKSSTPATIAGIGTPLLAFVVSQLSNVELIFRVLSLGIGILVGVASLISVVCRTIREERRFSREEREWLAANPEKKARRRSAVQILWAKFMRKLGLQAMVPVLLLAFMATGCTSMNSSGQRVYDPVKTEKVKAVFKQVTADATLLAISKDKGTQPYFSAAKQLICAVVNQNQPLDPYQLRMALEGTGLKQLRTIEAQVAINTICGAYEAAWADRVRADVAENVYANAVLSVLCDGLTMGLDQAEDLAK